MYLLRIDPDANMNRFYRIQLTTDLFGGTLLLRQWGRLGTGGQERRAWFANTAVAEHEMQRLNRLCCTNRVMAEVPPSPDGLIPQLP